MDTSSSAKTWETRQNVPDEYDCEKIIFEYGFTCSLEAAKHQEVWLYDTDESAVAVAVFRENLVEEVHGVQVRYGFETSSESISQVLLI